MAFNTLGKLDDLIEAVLTREGEFTGESLVIQNHVSQMKLLGLRQGIEMMPTQDDDRKSRKSFIDQLYKANKIDLYLDRYWDLLLCTGQVLFYLRPTGTTYRIYHYEKSQFKAYYDGDGELNEVIIIYSYKVRQQYSINNLKWIKLKITKEAIWKYESDNKPEFEYEQFENLSGERVENSLGFIPCVVANNYLKEGGQEGVGEFEWLRSQIESHDEILTSIKANIRFFGNPTLVSSRSVGELTEAGVVRQQPTLSSNGGWYGSTQSTRKSDPFERGGDSTVVKKVVGNVQGDERFGYISPDPVSPDHARYAAEYREGIHTAMGSIDPNSISSGATAFEVKSLFGRAAATAKKKALHLYTYGICKLFEMAIGAEERLFKQSIANAVTTDKSPVTVDMISDATAMNALTDPKLQAILKKAMWQPVGLPPLGDRTVEWRWLGPVFEDSPQDILQKSIVVRNLEEVGVETIKALEFLFSDKTEKERLAMLTGYPFREMQASGAALGQHLSILSQMMNTPNPMNPHLPIGATINNLAVISATLEHIQKRLSYGQQLLPASSAPYPSTSAPGDANSSTATGFPVSTTPVPGIGSNATPVPTGSNGAGNPIPNPSPAAAAGLFPPIALANGSALSGVSGTNGFGGSPAQRVDYAAPIPVPGGTVNAAASNPATQLPTVSPTPIPGIPTDLWDKPGLLATLFPDWFGGSQPPEPDVKRKRDRKRNPDRR